MKDNYIDILNIRRKVFTEIATLAFENEDLKRLREATYRLLPGEEATYRDSIFKERAIIGERLRLALGLDVRTAASSGPIEENIDKIDVDTRVYESPLINVIKFACEACPTKTYWVTNNCRSCLAHPCKNVCPRNVITITKKGAVIDQEGCIKCGRCKEVCPYEAIVKYDRPCAVACGVNAIGSDYLDRAEIDQEKCVSCGRCIQECPFGAISDKSEIFQLIKAIKTGKRVYGIIAPSFIGQFGQLTQPEQVLEGIKQLGIKDVIEVGLGADYTTLSEATEYIAEVPEKLPFMGTSCCSSWKMMVEKMFPEVEAMISESSTPMIYSARYVKQNDPEGLVVFIGPCISKKLEALQDDVSQYVDFVITFEELLGMFAAKNIEPSEIETETVVNDASRTGRGYAVAGGVAEAVRDAIKQLQPDKEVMIDRADTLADCVKMVQLAKAGRKDGYLLEGMACQFGCVGGPGNVSSIARAKKAVENFAKGSEYDSPLDNMKL